MNSSMSSSLRFWKKPSTLLRGTLILSLIIGCYIFVDWQNFQKYLSWDIFLIMLLAQIPAVAVVFFTALRHSFLVSKPMAPISTSLKAIFLAIGLNAVIPGRASETLKISYMTNKLSLKTSNCLAAVVLERTIDLFIIGASGLIAMIFISAYVDSLYLYLLVAFPVALFLFILLAIRIFTVPFVQSIFGKLYNFCMQTLSSLASLYQPQRLLIGLFIGLLVWASSFAFFYTIVGISGSIKLNFFEMLISFVIVTLGAAVPALPGSVGTYQAAVIIVLSWFGYSTEEALVLGIALNASIYLSTLPIALFIVSTDGTGLGNLIQRAYKALHKNNT